MEITEVINFHGRLIEIHSTVTNSMILLAGLTIFLIIAGKKTASADPLAKPAGIVLFMVILVDSIEKLVVETMGEKNRGFAPFAGMLVFYLIPANTMALIGLKPPTSDVSVTMALALFTIGMMIYFGIKAQGLGGTLRSMFLGEFPWLLPLEVISQLSRPISLSFRLFGNILSGVIILELIYQALGYFTPLAAPLLHGYFDLFDGLVQTMIFVMLAMIWTKGVTTPVHE